jgi:Asp-tRNA(Asn)/Glu-tRNA(Gln) amidotransferase A subunit family amidase
MALSWTQDRLGPICRYAEDCALVMQAVSRPDGRDMSVTDLPFNWNAELDIRQLKVGIIQASFDELTNAAAKANAAAMLEQLKAVGVRAFIPVAVPDVPGQSQRHLGGILRLLRRARARRPYEGHPQRTADRPAGFGGGLPAVAARAHDDDAGTGQGHRGS